MDSYRNGGAPSGSDGRTLFVGYIAEADDGRTAFVKALDYSGALASPDPARALEGMTAAYNFERDVLRSCRDKGMSRIVKLLGDGKVDVTGAVGPPVVNYLLLERAQGDVRTYLDALDKIDLAWALRSAHQVATAVMQLHRGGIAHQDVKPSNVLVMAENQAKLTDVGRASYLGHASPFDMLTVVGDLGYAPPELLYGFRSPEWSIACLACDLYLLGSMIVFLFHGMAMSPLLFSHMHPEQGPGYWGDGYHEVLPFLREAFDRVMTDFKMSIPAPPGQEISQLVRYLCDPDPELRGHPTNRRGHANRYSLERFVSRLDLLARRAERGLLGAMT